MVASGELRNETMLLNKQRKTAREDSDPNSLCPECDGPLIGKRGEIKTWHWAHRSLGDCSGGGEETEWHLRMKAVCHSWPGWEIEFPIKLNGQQYFLDAHNPATGEVLEFVHSLSPYYEAKHIALKTAGLDVKWILDGAEFVAASSVFRERWPCVMYNLLKPAAFLLHQKLGVFVWHHNIFWAPTKSDPSDTPRKVTRQDAEGKEFVEFVDDKWAIETQRQVLKRLLVDLNT
jgi:competence CoiA-like predicted nuclease